MTPSPDRVAPVARAAPAKLNLTLAVLGRREDGYHALHSVMVPLGLADTVTVEVAGRGETADALQVEGAAGSLTAGPDNLVLRAIAATRAAVLVWRPGARGKAEASFLAARLTKRIPVAAGLAGGSSDAAAAMSAALEAWGADLPPDVAEEVAASLGSDVPFFLAGGAALVTGRGEHVEPLPPLRGVAPAVLLVTPRLHVSTPAVFAAYAAGTRPASAMDGATAAAASERLAADWRAGMQAATLLERAAELAVANDLLPATLEVAPELAAFRRTLGELLGRPIGQSGSGPTAWVLYPSLGGRPVGCPRGRRAPRTRRRRWWLRPRSFGAHNRPSPRHPDKTQGGEPQVPRQADHRVRSSGRNRTVQPGHRHRRLPVLLRLAGHGSCHRAVCSTASRPRPSGRS